MPGNIRQDSVQGAQAQPAHILIADDDPPCRAMLEKAFHRLGCPTIACTTGSDAWAELQAQPQVLAAIMNWMLPGIDGHEIARRLHQQRSNVTVVLMVGQSFAHEAWSKLRLNSHYILAKPFSEKTANDQARHILELALQRSSGSPATSARDSDADPENLCTG